MVLGGMVLGDRALEHMVCPTKMDKAAGFVYFLVILLAHTFSHRQNPPHILCERVHMILGGSCVICIFSLELRVGPQAHGCGSSTLNEVENVLLERCSLKPLDVSH